MKTKPLPRKIHLPSGEWSYKVGRSGVRIRTPDCSKTDYVPFETLLGLSQSQVDDMKFDFSEVNKPMFSDTHVTPAAVKDYVEKTLQG